MEREWESLSTNGNCVVLGKQPLRSSKSSFLTSINIKQKAEDRRLTLAIQRYSESLVWYVKSSYAVWDRGFLISMEALICSSLRLRKCLGDWTTEALPWAFGLSWSAKPWQCLLNEPYVLHIRCLSSSHASGSSQRCPRPSEILSIKAILGKHLSGSLSTTYMSLALQN